MGGLGGRWAWGSAFLSPGRIVALLKRVLSCGPTVTLGLHFWAHCAFVDIWPVSNTRVMGQPARTGLAL